MMLLRTRFLFDSWLFCPDYQLYLRLFFLKVMRVVAGVLVMCFLVQSSEKERYRERLTDCFSKRARNFLFSSLLQTSFQISVVWISSCVDNQLLWLREWSNQAPPLELRVRSAFTEAHSCMHKRESDKNLIKLRKWVHCLLLDWNWGALGRIGWLNHMGWIHHHQETKTGQSLLGKQKEHIHSRYCPT